MMVDKLTKQEWLGIIRASAAEVATVALGYEKCDATAREATISSDHIGAYLPLGSSERPMQVALLAAPSGCQALAKALLGMEPSEEDLGDADLSDAVSEILNVLAGGIKRGAQGRVEVQLGLPLFVKGVVQTNENLTILAVDLDLGAVSAVVLLVSSRQSETKRASGTGPVSVKQAV